MRKSTDRTGPNWTELVWSPPRTRVFADPSTDASFLRCRWIVFVKPLGHQFHSTLNNGLTVLVSGQRPMCRDPVVDMARCVFPIMVGITSTSVPRGGHNRDREQRVDGAALDFNIDGTHLAGEPYGLACLVEVEVQRNFIVNIACPMSGSTSALAHNPGSMSPGPLTSSFVGQKRSPLWRARMLTQVRQQCLERADALHRLCERTSTRDLSPCLRRCSGCDDPQPDRRHAPPSARGRGVFHRKSCGVDKRRRCRRTIQTSGSKTSRSPAG